MRLAPMTGVLALLCLPPAPVHSLPRAQAPTTHPRLYFSAADLPHLRAKQSSPFMAGVLRQYSDALNHKLNYSAGGVLTDVGSPPAKSMYTPPPPRPTT